ncbi:hypothetical protein ACHAP5_011687 [Fusarium lateritium]
MDDLNRAIIVMEKAVAIGLADGHPDVSSYLDTMALLRNERFKLRYEGSTELALGQCYGTLSGRSWMRSLNLD